MKGRKQDWCTYGAPRTNHAVRLSWPLLCICIIARAYDPAIGWYDEAGNHQFDLRRGESAMGMGAEIRAASNFHNRKMGGGHDGRAGINGTVGDAIVFNTAFPQTQGAVTTKLAYLRVANFGADSQSFAVEITTDEDWEEAPWVHIMDISTQPDMDGIYQRFSLTG